jgi:hypothetical protein
MGFDLIPLPISIIFVFVFGLVCMAVLWKLRKRSKIYSLLFSASLIAVMLLFIALLYSIITTMLV